MAQQTAVLLIMLAAQLACSYVNFFGETGQGLLWPDKFVYARPL